MMKHKKKLLLLGLLPVAFATSSNPILCLLAYFIGYPSIIIYAFCYDKKTTRAFFLYGCGVLYFLAQMNWLALAKYHGSLIIVAYLFFSFLFPFCFYFLGYLLPKKPHKLNLTTIGWLSLCYVFLEYCRLWILCGFPFHVTGLLLTSNIYSLQLASLIGLYGLSFLVISQSLYTAKCFFLKAYYNAVGFSLLPFFLGFILYHGYDLLPKNKEKVKVAIVQTGLKVEEKWQLDKFDKFFIPNNLQLKNIWNTLEKIPPTDLVVLPEVCLPGDGSIKRYTIEELKEIFPRDVWGFFSSDQSLSNLDVFSALSIYLNTDIMIGFIANGMNSCFYLSEGKIQGRYDKRRLLPFGEYIPMDFLKSLAKRYGIEDFFSPGTKTNIISGKWNILPSICFDEGFPDDFLKFYTMKPQLHINLTNDAWFIGSSLSHSHFELGKARSVENGIFSLRGCNTGISAIITPKGEVRKHLLEKNADGIINKGVILDSFYLYSQETFFSKIGNLGLLLFVGSCLTLAKFLRKKVVTLKA